MARSSVHASLSVQELVEAVERLVPADLAEFRRRLAARLGTNGDPMADEVRLTHAAKARLPAAAERRLKRLIDKSERGELTPTELADYQTLAQRAQRIDAARLEALAEPAPSVPN